MVQLGVHQPFPSSSALLFLLGKADTMLLVFFGSDLKARSPGTTILSELLP
ncbi:hypothetical protein DPMN_048597 [Dreissena polymorpha]|uniref:Uncharacterized protein n=1 Tax=Dreissena polymorpha TaxID=45954 RepID=A0A9D4DBW4_DREPO|nr:hypothetical protein DPMN_048597 [Dreissena polymorpha]